MMVVGMTAAVQAAEVGFPGNGSGTIAEGITYTAVNDQGVRTVVLSVAEGAELGTIIVLVKGSEYPSSVVIDVVDTSFAEDYVYVTAKGGLYYTWVPEPLECLHERISVVYDYDAGQAYWICDDCGEWGWLEYDGTLEGVGVTTVSSKGSNNEWDVTLTVTQMWGEYEVEVTKTFYNVTNHLPNYMEKTLDGDYFKVGNTAVNASGNLNAGNASFWVVDAL